MSGMKNDFLMPILVLSLLCLLVSGALAFGNKFTQPVIEEAAALRVEAARRDIIPQADGFVLLEIENLSKAITEVYGTTNNVGFIFMVTTNGYGGDIKLICGIDQNGKVIKTAVLAQNETKGLGTPVFEEPHAGQYRGKDKDSVESVQAISGATISSKALKKGIRESLEAFEIVKGVRQ